MKSRVTSVYLLFILVLAVFLSSCGTARRTAGVRGAPGREASKRDRSEVKKIDDLLDFAQKHVGVKYRYGGNSPREGFDCSGFTCYVFNEFGMQLPRISADMSREGRYVGKNELQKGDLVFFATGRGRRINHVGIITDIHPRVLMIHSSTSKGVRIDDVNSDYYRRRYITARRISF